ncbi:DUF3098 domain-containing protein [Fodinibius saliphilus]|uniref:DUF3098 domain-containing protein n=1 Tax=Fodinibius saliphilus TaxID=1920650 RepID=UPI0011080C07|nr:DUF3098 domain-containing protein [Fodinibius saliphilus]
MATKQRKNNRMIFSSWNYKVLALGILLVIAGFSAMYIENEVNGFISLYISPIVIMTGYITVIVSIMKHDDETGKASEES